MIVRSWFLAAALAVLPAVSHADESVVTYHNSNLRHGAYRVRALTLAEAANVKRDTRFTASVSGNIYAQPLFWKPKGATRGLVIVATENNAVYALDERTGATVWKQQLAASVPLNKLPCGNIDPMGITGTPVIDPIAKVLYLDADTTTGNGPRHLVYALSLADGSVVHGWPIDMQAAITGKGGAFDDSVGERSALLFFNNKLYVDYGGMAGDCGAYHGTVAQIAPDSASLDAYWQTRAGGGGIWAQGGIAGDGQALYVTTGNTFGASSWSDGEAIVKLLPGLAHSTRTRDYFAPSNWKSLDGSDADLGGTEALPLNVLNGGDKVHRVIAFGKDGKAYLTDRRNLGGIGGQIQTLTVSGGAIRTAPAVYETTSGTMVAFQSSGGGSCSGSNITMLNVALSGGSPMSVAWCAQFDGRGAPIVTTTDGSANPIVWVVGAEGDNKLHGFNALTGAAVYSGTDTMAGLHHFQTLIATGKRFYVGADNTVYAFTF
jgi:hypothetical protein